MPPILLIGLGWAMDPDRRLAAALIHVPLNGRLAELRRPSRCLVSARTAATGSLRRGTRVGPYGTRPLPRTTGLPGVRAALATARGRQARPVDLTSYAEP